MNGYTTDISGVFDVALGIKREQVPVRMVLINPEGGELAVSNPIAIQAKGELKLEQVDHPIAIRIDGLKPSASRGYQQPFVLLNKSWPYATWVKLTMMGVEELPSNQACLKALGLQWGCSLEDVEDAYHLLVRKVHPDRGGTIEQFVALREHYVQARNLVGK